MSINSLSSCPAEDERSEYLQHKKMSRESFNFLAGYSFGLLSQAKADPLIRYEFTQKTCRKGTFSDSAGVDEYFGDLTINRSSAQCAVGPGLRGTTNSPGWPGASSEWSASSLRQALDPTYPFHGVTFEIWLSPGDSITCSGRHACSMPIVSFSNKFPGTSDSCSVSSGLEVIYMGLDGYLRFHFGYPGLCEQRVCYSYVEPSVYPTHFVYTIFDSFKWGRLNTWIECFINGSYVDYQFMQSMYPVDILNAWSDNHTLQVLDRRRAYFDGRNYWPFQGTLYYFALHDERFTGDMARAAYNATLTDSIVTVSNITVFIPEDGEVGDHYEQPEYYRQEVPADELYQVNLTVHDFDRDPRSPNSGKISTRHTIYLCSLPTRGKLFDRNGDEIRSTPFPVLEADGKFTVRFRPMPLNAYSLDGSIFDRFTYYAVDGATGERSFDNATVEIIVVAKNDPPIAEAANGTAYALTRKNVLQLHATDPEGDHIEVFIWNLPRLGTLYQVCKYPDGSRSFRPISESFLSVSATANGSFNNFEILS